MTDSGPVEAPTPPPSVPVLHRPETVGQIEGHGNDTYEVVERPDGTLSWARQVHESPDGMQHYDPPVLDPIPFWTSAELFEPVAPTVPVIGEPPEVGEVGEPPDVAVVVPADDLDEIPVTTPTPPSTGLTLDELGRRFARRQATPEQAEKIDDLRRAVMQLAGLIRLTVPDGRERALAVTALEEALMWARAAVERPAS